MSGPCRRWRPAPVADEGRARDRVVSTLSGRFPDVGVPTIEARVDAAWAELDEARVRDFVPVLVTRQIDEQLRRHRTT